MPEVVHVPKASREQVSPERDVEDSPLFLETMNIIHEVFVPRGIEANPSITAALAYFLTRRGETSLDTVASKFMVSLDELKKAQRDYQEQF